MNMDFLIGVIVGACLAWAATFISAWAYSRR